jgi:putative peptide-modifying radical SAM enzyme
MHLRKLEEIMDAMPGGNFVLQTNGILLDQLNPSYVNTFESIFVSLDGDETITDYYRGTGTFRKVIGNLRKIREDGYRGEIVARMTVAEATEIDKQALVLIENPLISSVHWQLDALFWQNDYSKRDFSKWVKQDYNPRVTHLIKKWVEQMRIAGKVWSLYPFVGVTRSLLMSETTRLRCGAGWCVFNIQTDGYVTPCPVMAGMKDYYVGNILTDSPRSLRKLSIEGPCSNCELMSLCGGRCLYANVTNLWGIKGFDEVCETVRNLVHGLTDVLPQIKGLLEVGRIDLTDFHDPKYNGCEVIP